MQNELTVSITIDEEQRNPALSAYLAHGIGPYEAFFKWHCLAICALYNAYKAWKPPSLYRAQPVDSSNI